MSHTLVIFGASGDLTSRKLVPAMYSQFRKQRLAEKLRIVGSARTPMESAAWRESLGETTAQFAGRDFDPAAWRRFAESIEYFSGDATRRADVEALQEKLRQCEQGESCTRVYYLATAPQFFEPIVNLLGGHVSAAAVTMIAS